ncbi:hypothetical protein TYRP_020432 [Tyrophagus putrescentiae]|nr:hypothetical protein TYRP_020432 [Tyrophagus putrescentiae]
MTEKENVTRLIDPANLVLSLTVKLNLASLLDEHDDVAANVDHGVVGGGGGGGGGDKKDERKVCRSLLFTLC